MEPNLKNPENIEVGNVVYLKSHSAAMTVKEIIGENALCIWQDDKGIDKEKPYELILLTKIKPGNSPLGIYLG